MEKKHSSNRGKMMRSKDLLKVFEQEVANLPTFQYIGEPTNPCHIMLDDIEFYVYIKNISSAYFSNPDVSRVQLTGIDTLLNIKKSDALFILLGYDAINHVFAAWNPHIAKQRIGTASSPSLYSRFSWQTEAATNEGFISRELKNDGSVLLFRQENITLFLSNIDKFFSDTSEYVAVGSKRRIEANAAYRELVNTHHMGKYASYLRTTGIEKNVGQQYVSSIKQLINKSIISTNRKIFLTYDQIEDYRLAVEMFLAIDEVKSLDAETDNIYSAAMRSYIEFLIKEYGEEANNGSAEDVEYTPAAIVEDFVQNNESISDVDYETRYVDENGILTCIANPKLINLLREDLDSEYPRPMAAYATVEDFYGDRFPNMQMFHWQKLFNRIDWTNPYVVIDDNKSDDITPDSARKKISVTLANGTVICEKKVVDTLMKVIQYAGIDKVRGLKITMGKDSGTPMITSEVSPKYPHLFKELGNGLYLNTCSATQTKFMQIHKINKGLGLGMKVELV